MITGAFLTKLTVWLALAGYALGTAFIVRSSSARARWAWTLGCAFYLAHVLSAFGFFHGWSHAAAYEETARQTRELAGWNWGGGLFVNYLFTLVWVADVTWWWLAPATHPLIVAGFGVPPLGGQASRSPRVQHESDALPPDRLKAELRTPHRARIVTALIHGFFLFMVFNGTVVFGRGPVRWYGAAICAVVVDLWVRKFRARIAAK